MASYERGINFLHAVAKALGLASQPIQKIVLEIPIDGVPTIYVKGLLYRERGNALLDTFRQVRVKDVSVQDDGDVSAEDPTVIHCPKT